MSQTPSEPPRPDRPAAGRLPAFRVVLHHCPEAGPMVVVRTVMELTRMSRAEATHKMWEAHHRGTTLLMTAHRERAELYQEMFARRFLRVTIEPA
jgi:ATP-dependent Clp protease adapter protein ClpS